MLAKHAILDTNLLVILITGAVDTHLLRTFKRVKAFDEPDVRLLAWLVRQFRGIVTTAYALAETSNLGNALTGWKRDRWYQELSKFAALTNEAHVSTQKVGASELVVRFGITDAALHLLANEYVLLTAEYRLAGFLEDLGIDVVNFNNLRALWLTEGSER